MAINALSSLNAEKPQYAPRPPFPGMRLFHGVMGVLPEVATEAYEEVRAGMSAPFVGLTTDGTLRPGLVTAAAGPSTKPITDAATAFLEALHRPDQRQLAVAAFDHPYRRWWFNAFPDWWPTGLLLDDLTQPERDAALRVVELSLGPEGYDEARKTMRLNGLLGDFVQTYVDSLREWTYFFTIFGEPRADQPWAWQLMGHHLDLNCLVLPEHVELTPMFMGSEFNNVEGITVYEAHADQALALARSLTTEQRDLAVLYPTMDPDKLPPELSGLVDGRHRGGAGRDNLVIEYAGIGATDLDGRQQESLLALIDVYLKRLPETQRAHRALEVRRHLDETHFAWIGDIDAGAPFYYRIHSPVIWLEFDHHQGVFLDNNLPEPYHVHTIIRTPNGADYGAHLVPLPAGDAV
jgi:Protein of unknown function (DUF3500)